MMIICYGGHFRLSIRRLITLTTAAAVALGLLYSIHETWQVTVLVIAALWLVLTSLNYVILLARFRALLHRVTIETQV
jgi:hypothetical protein